MGLVPVLVPQTTLTADAALAFYDFTDTSSMTVERNGTGGAPGALDPIGTIADKGPFGLNAVAPTDAARPLWQSGGYARHDLVDDTLQVTAPATLTGKLGFATTDGIGVYDASISAGTWRFSPSGGYMPGRDLIAVCAFPATVSEALVRKFLEDNTGASGNYSGVTSFVNYWRERPEITNFASDIDTASGVSFNSACRGMKITTFPSFDFSSATSMVGAFQACNSLISIPSVSFPLVENAQSAFQGNSGLTTVNLPANAFPSCTNCRNLFYACGALTTFPAGVFNNCPSTNFIDAFFNCGLTAQSVENIVVSIEAAGTSGGTLDLDGGTSAAPNATAAAAISALTGRGWTVTTN